MGFLPPINVCAQCDKGMTHAAKQTKESAKMVSKLLEENHSDYHIFTTEEDEKGVYLHNHIAHHAVTLWALGATPEELQEHHTRNTLYQRLPPLRPKSVISEAMKNDTIYKALLGNEDFYLDWVDYFEKEIRDYGYPYVLQKYLVGDTWQAKDMLPRMYMGYVHSVMHVGMALEFNQMQLMAEGFAQAVVHHDHWYNDIFDACEEEAKLEKECALPLSTCLELCRKDPGVKNSSSIDYQLQRDSNGNFVLREEMIRDGVCAKGGEALKPIAARYRVDPNNLEKATAELINSAVWMSVAAQRAPYECRADFFMIHGTNMSLWHSAFLKEPTMSNEQKARLLEYSGRVIMILYACVGCPEPNIPYLMSHPPRFDEPEHNTWEGVFRRACKHEDDGHMPKLIRAIAHSRQVSEKYNDCPEFMLKQKHHLPAAIAMIDSSSKQPMEGSAHFDLIRGADWEEAWLAVPHRPKTGERRKDQGEKPDKTKYVNGVDPSVVNMIKSK